jgi:peroxiredoxin
MRTVIRAIPLLALIIVSAAWTGSRFVGSRFPGKVSLSSHRSTADGSGHTRGVVQVDLMRALLAARDRDPAWAGDAKSDAAGVVPSQRHPLLGRPAPTVLLQDKSGIPWNLGGIRQGPTVLVFYLGSTCMTCMTHLTELDRAVPRFVARRAQILAISADTRAFAAERARQYGDFQIPLLSDADRSAARSYGTCNAGAGSETNQNRAQHGTFIVDGDGIVRWVHVGDLPFTNIEAILAELDRFTTPRS